MVACRRTIGISFHNGRDHLAVDCTSMRVERLKRWHWALVGCFLGLVVAWAWGSVQESAGLLASPTLGAEEFERLLGEGLFHGHPWVKDIRLHRDGDRDWVTMKVLRPDPKDPHPKNPRRYRYVGEQLNATTPFMPDFREFPTQTVMIRINPSAISKAHNLGKHENEGALPLWVNGAAARVDEIAARLHLENWNIQTGDWADPGSSAQVGLTLRPAHYDMMIVLSAKQQTPPTASELNVKFNRHDVPLSGPSVVSSGLVFKASIPRDYFVGGDKQIFEFSRSGAPVRIWEIRLIDPTYSVADYLAFLRQSRPDLSFGSAWWETGWVRYTLCALIGAALFAGCAPFFVLLFLGAQSKSLDGEYDLDRFKGEAAKEASTANAEVELDLTALEAKVAEGLRPRIAASAAEVSPPPPVKQLDGDSDRPAIVEADREAEEFQGEFYPVARPHKHEQKP